MLPLEGLRVVDLTRVLAGPYCTMMLGDLGADVVKVEEPGHGDDMRSWAPFLDSMSLYFAGVNRNKRSITLNLRSAAGAGVLWRLIERADVLIENFRPGGLARLGFGYEAVKAIRPSIIYCSISGYGQTGPRHDEPGYDPVIQAESGLMDVTGAREGPPTRSGVPIVDYVAGLHAIQGILVALLERQRTGAGRYLDLSLLDSITSTLVLQHGLVQTAGTAPRLGNEHPAIAPYETLAASDGLLMIAVGNDRLWRAFCDAIDAAPLLDDRRFATNADRLQHRPALRQAIEAAIRTMTVDQLVARLRARSVPCGRVRTAAEALADPQLEARGMFVAFEDVPGFRALAHPLQRADAAPARRPPALGEHTRQVLAELGYAPGEIDAVLREA